MSKPNYLELPLWEYELRFFPKEACHAFLNCIVYEKYADARKELDALCTLYPEEAPKVSRLYKDIDFAIAHF
jgi:hypothetical protein